MEESHGISGGMTVFARDGLALVGMTDLVLAAGMYRSTLVLRGLHVVCRYESR